MRAKCGRVTSAMSAEAAAPRFTGFLLRLPGTEISAGCQCREMTPPDGAVYSLAGLPAAADAPVAGLKSGVREDQFRFLDHGDGRLPGLKAELGRALGCQELEGDAPDGMARGGCVPEPDRHGDRSSLGDIFGPSR